MKPAFNYHDILMFYKYLKQSENYFEFGAGGSTYQAFQLPNIKNIFSVESSLEWIHLIIDNIKSNDYQIINSPDKKIENKKLHFYDINFNTKIGHLGLPIYEKNDKIECFVQLNNKNINNFCITKDKKYSGIVKNIETQKPFLHLIEFTDNQIPNKWTHPKVISIINKNTIECFNIYSNIILTLDKNIKIDLILIDGRFRVICALKCHSVIQESCIILIDDFLNRDSYHILLNYYDIIEKGDKMVALRKKKNVFISKELLKKYETDVR